MCAATNEDNALDIVRRNTCISQLLVDVGDDFSSACADVIGSFTCIDVLNVHVAHIARIKRVVDVLLDILGSLLKYILAVHHVTGKVAASQGKSAQVDERLVLVDGHCGGLGTHIHEHAAQFTVAITQDLFAHSQRGNDIVLNRYAEAHHTVEVELERWLGNNQVDLDFY